MLSRYKAMFMPETEQGIGTVISAFFTIMALALSQIGKIFAFCASGYAKCESHLEGCAW